MGVHVGVHVAQQLGSWHNPVDQFSGLFIILELWIHISEINPPVLKREDVPCGISLFPFIFFYDGNSAWLYSGPYRSSF